MLVIIAGVAVLVFGPGLRAGLTSDDFDFYRRASVAGAGDVFGYFVPNNYFWYRPIQDVAFWLEVLMFGYNPTAYHVVSLIGHVISTVLLWQLAIKLGSGRVGAAVTAIVFVTTIHAHEVVWWWADLHYAFGGPLIVAALLAWISGHRLLAIVVTSAALLADESSVLIIPLAAALEFITSKVNGVLQRTSAAARTSLVLLVPMALYFCARLVVGRGIWGESAPCHTPACVVSGLVSYGTRLVLRPDRMYGVYADHKFVFIAFSAVALSLLVAVALRNVRTKPAAVFGLVWSGVTCFFFVLALWPYASDRFLYYPDMGIAIAIGGFADLGLTYLPSLNRALRWSLVPLAGAILLGWVAAGVHMLEVRAQGWLMAGNQAAAIVDGIHSDVPSPPPDTLLIVDGVPDSSAPPFPPGNTGPYVFRNGLQSAVQRRYGRTDVFVEWAGHSRTGSYSTTIRLHVRADDSVSPA